MTGAGAPALTRDAHLSTWQAPGAGECHAWLIPIERRPAWTGLLDEPERARAEQLRAGGPVLDTFVTSRGAQRLVGSRYLGLPPDEIRIERCCQYCGAEHGRPSFGASPLDYSVSHAGGWVVITVVGVGQVGVDIESVATDRDVNGLAAITLSAAEARRFARLGRAERPASFLRSWTRKEAAMKVTGFGLRAPPNQLDVAREMLAVGQIPRWPATPVHLYDLPAPPGYIGALAVTAPITSVRHAVLSDSSAAAAR